MQIHELTALARNSKASDIHISEGLPLMFRSTGIWRRHRSSFRRQRRAH